MNTLIKAKSIVKSFKEHNVLNNIDFNIHSGETIAIVGPNGVGKTTLLNILLGVLKPDTGTVEIWKDDYKAHIGVHLQSTAFFEDYTSRENILMFAALYNINIQEDEINDILKKHNLNKKTKALKLSMGEQKKLAIAIATMHNPELLILDEPSSNLDPREKYNIRNMILELSKKNITILFTSHDLSEVNDVASRIVFLYNGEIVANGSKEELLEKHKMGSLEDLYIALTV